MPQTPQTPVPLDELYPDPEVRNFRHYLFAHKFLPAVAHASPRGLFADPWLRDDPSAFVQTLWWMTDPELLHQKRPIAGLDARLARAGGWPVLFVDMPPPEECPKAYFVAVLLRPPVAAGGEPTAEVVTLERTMNFADESREGDTGVLCRWDANGTHVNLGRLLTRTREAFADEVRRMPSPPGAADADAVLARPAPPGAPRGRAEVQRDCGSDDEAFQIRYMSYFMTLVRGRGDWNADIGDFARSLGALRDSEVESARENLHQAVLNRLLVRAAAERRHVPLTTPQRRPWWRFW